ncbi:MAG: transglycosylase SLT domain-containing protein, partial [Saprospiraceae bacterium]|nr:transglycosylase SLT domain-containing protein [Saprospiraceae bacterium]
RHIDERKDPAKATVAAIEYLRILHDKYQDWTLTFAAYNAGPGTVNKAIRYAGGQTSFEAIRSFLPKETQRYIPKYIAAQYIVEHYIELGMTPTYASLDLQITGHVLVHEYLTLTDVAEVTGLPKELLNDLNPSLRRGYVPSLTKGYNLVLPKRVIPVFEYYLATKEFLPNPFEYRTFNYVVDSTKSIYEIAAQLSVDPFLLKYWNHLTSETVHKGQTILIHEVHDPSQAVIMEEEPVLMEEVMELNMLPPSNQTDSWIESRLVLFDKLRIEEQTWQLHQER